MRVALIGASGQLGTALQQSFATDRASAQQPAWSVVPLGHAEIEITDPASVEAALSKAQPACVINTAAYNLVDRAEDEPQVAYSNNALGPRNLAQWCAGRDVPLVHISTDYVFGLDAGRSELYDEDDPPGPQSAYAVSKLTGEYFVRAICPRHIVVRTCGLYGRATSPGKGNFIETMLRLGRERGAVRVVDDQHCTPTGAADLADALVRLIAADVHGLFHATNAGATTWCGLAREVFRLARMEVEVTPITTEQFGAKARRPNYSVLRCDKLRKATGTALPDWQNSVARYLATRPTTA